MLPMVAVLLAGCGGTLAGSDGSTAASRPVAQRRPSPPSWASAGFLAYKCSDSLCLIRPNGSGRRALLSRAGSPWPQWDSAFAPDGRAVAFRGYFGLGDGDYALYTAQAGGCDVRRLTRSIAGNPSWSSNGRWIVFDTSGYGVIWKLHPDGTALTRVVGTGGGNADEAPAWSPNGRVIAFVRYQKGRGELWLVGADGRNPRLLHRDSRGSVGAPAWSNDGTRIAFPVRTTQGKSIISVIGADGSKLRRLTSPTGDAWNPTWLPGDRGIAYLEPAGNRGAVVVIRPDGSGATRLALPKTDQFSWIAHPLPPRC